VNLEKAHDKLKNVINNAGSPEEIIQVLSKDVQRKIEDSLTGSPSTGSKPLKLSSLLNHYAVI